MTIEEVRKLCEEGAFKRTIVDRRADDLHWDMLTLSCGHTEHTMPGFPRDGLWDCEECMKEALKESK